MDAALVTPSGVWIRIFVLVALAMFVGALFHAIKVGIYEYDEARQRRDPRLAQATAGITQVGFLLFFVVAYWFLESLAHHLTPYFVYSKEFPDGVSLLSFGGTPPAHLLPFKPSKVDCPGLVQELSRWSREYDQIPLSVLMMEASLTYAAMWTALMLRAGYRLVPLWAALFAVSIDMLLDPVVASTYDCEGIVRDASGPGLGFWHWFLPDDRLGAWFGVPLFNYAAWWTAPVILISFAMFLQYFRGYFWRNQRKRISSARPLDIVKTAPTSPLYGLTAGVLFAAFVLVLITDRKISVTVQWTVISAALVATAVYVVRRIRNFETYAEPDPNLTLPPLLFLGLPSFALLIEGLFLDIPGLVLVGVASVVVVVTFTLWPYQETVRRLSQRIVDLDRFIRIAYYGFSSILVLTGAFSVALERTGGVMEFTASGWQIAGLLAVALSFQIFAYVSNDVIDLDIDVEQPKRRFDPLVRNARSGGEEGISREAALAFALVQIPFSLLVSFLMDAGKLATGCLLAAFALMTVYNVFGKWPEQALGGRRRLLPTPLPPLTDAIQATSWGLLVFFGALITDHDRTSDNWIVVWTQFAFAAGFIMLVNGIHGGLRDLQNDIKHRCWTTARWLGAQPTPGGAVVSNRKIRVYTYAIHALMFWALPLWTLIGPGTEGAARGLELTDGQRLAVGLILAAAFAWSQWVLRGVVRDVEPKRDYYISVQPLVMMQTPLFAFVPFILGREVLFILAVAFYAPVLATESVIDAILRYTHPGLGSIRRTDPPAASE